MTLRSPIKCLLDLIGNYMSVTNRNLFYENPSQAYDHSQLSLVASFLDASVTTANDTTNNKKIDGTTGMSETIKLNVIENYNIVLRGSGAIDRKYEMIVALKSTLAKNLQENNNFSFNLLDSTIDDNSELDQQQFIESVAMRVSINYSVIKKVDIDYYNDFEASLNVEDSQNNIDTATISIEED